MAKVDKAAESTETQQATSSAAQNEKAMKLVAEVLAGRVADIKPQLELTSELGFTYPAIEQALEVKGKKVVSILESLADKGILKRDFFDKLLQECHVVGTPGSGFGPAGEGYFRLSAFGDKDKVREAVKRIEQKWGR